MFTCSSTVQSLKRSWYNIGIYFLICHSVSHLCQPIMYTCHDTCIHSLFWCTFSSDYLLCCIICSEPHIPSLVNKLKFNLNLFQYCGIIKFVVAQSWYSKVALSHEFTYSTKPDFESWNWKSKHLPNNVPTNKQKKPTVHENWFLRIWRTPKYLKLSLSL